MVKKGGNSKMGRPQLTEDERMVRIESRMRPGDVERLARAAQRRGIPTGTLIRDGLLAFLVLVEEPEAFMRAGVEAWRVDFGAPAKSASAGGRERTRELSKLARPRTADGVGRAGRGSKPRSAL
jgi:hypothetical protein